MKVKAEIPYKVAGDIYNIMFERDPKALIEKLQDAIKNCHAAGYDNLEIKWDWRGDAAPSIYGDREENEKEVKARMLRLKKQEKQKQEEIRKAKELLAKYGEKM